MKGIPSILWFMSHMVAMVGTSASPGCSWEPETPLGIPTWMAGVQVLGRSSAAFLGTSAGSWISSKAKRDQSSILIWDARVPSGRLTCCATALALVLCLQAGS